MLRVGFNKKIASGRVTVSCKSRTVTRDTGAVIPIDTHKECDCNWIDPFVVDQPVDHSVRRLYIALGGHIGSQHKTDHLNRRKQNKRKRIFVSIQRASAGTLLQQPIRVGRQLSKQTITEL